jgi:hypothetical protein
MAEMEKYVGSTSAMPSTPAGASGIDPVVLQQLVTMQILQQYPMLGNDPQLLQTFVVQQMNAIIQMQQNQQLQASATQTSAPGTFGTNEVAGTPACGSPKKTQALQCEASAPLTSALGTFGVNGASSTTEISEETPAKSTTNTAESILQSKQTTNLQSFTTVSKSLEMTSVCSESSHSVGVERAEPSSVLPSINRVPEKVQQATHNEEKQNTVRSLLKNSKSSFKSGFYARKSQPSSETGTDSSKSSCKGSEDWDGTGTRSKFSKLESRSTQAATSGQGFTQSSLSPPASYGYSFQSTEDWDEEWDSSIGRVNIPTFSKTLVDGKFKATSISQLVEEAVTVHKTAPKPPRTRGRRGRNSGQSSKTAESSASQADSDKSRDSFNAPSSNLSSWDSFSGARDTFQPKTYSDSVCAQSSKLKLSSSDSFSEVGNLIHPTTSIDSASVPSSKFKFCTLDSFSEAGDLFQPKFKPPESFMPVNEQSDRKSNASTDGKDPIFVTTKVTPEKEDEEWQEVHVHL